MNKGISTATAGLIMALLILTTESAMAKNALSEAGQPETVSLPMPVYEGKLSVEAALKRRRSVREYSDSPLTVEEVSQLLWAAQGITGSYGMRTAPSAGALYPLEIYLVAGKVKGLAPGIYRYVNKKHALLKVADGDFRKKLSAAALGQECVRDGATSIVISGVYERTAKKYGERASQYVHIEVGGVAENIYLQAQALNLGTVFVGAFRDKLLKALLKMTDRETPLGIMPVGRKR